MRRVHYDKHFLLGLLAVISGCFSELYIGCRLDGVERVSQFADDLATSNTNHSIRKPEKKTTSTSTYQAFFAAPQIVFSTFPSR